MKRMIKRLSRKIKRLVRYLPVIWNSEDFDSGFATELFRMKLEDMAVFFEGNDGVYAANAKQYAGQIRRILRLFDWVYNDENISEFHMEMEALWGAGVNEFVEMEYPTKHEGARSWSLVFAWEEWDNVDEVRKSYKELMVKYENKRKKAHKLLWRLIEENIEYWWD
jgi:DnaJ-domain-containing protein 1